MIFTTENLIEIGKIKNLTSYWNVESKTLFLRRVEGPFIPIYKGELFHLARVLLRIFQKGFYRKKK